MFFTKPCFDVTLVRAVFPAPSIGEELDSATCADLGVVSILFLHLTPIGGDAAVRRAEECLPALSGVYYKFFSALLAARVSVLPWDDIVSAAVHSD